MTRLEEAIKASGLDAPEAYRVIAAIDNHQGRDAIRETIRWDSLMGCFTAQWAGMFLGIETDGYIHS